MSPRRILAVVLRHFYLMRGSIARVLPLFVWVTVDIILWGFLSKYLNKITSTGPNFVPVLLGAVLFWDFFTRVMHGVTMAFFEDVWSRNFLNFFSTPLSTWEYQAGLVLSSVVTSAAGLLLMVFLATAFFGLSFFAYGLTLLPFLMVLFLFGISLGIFGSALVLRFGPASEWFVWPIPALLSPFAGVFYPLSILPSWMQVIGKLLPPSYVFESMRAVISGGNPSHLVLLWSACLALLYVGLACLFFNHVYRHAVRVGLLARYTAESIS